MEKVARARNAPDAWMIAASTLFQKRQFRQAQDDAEQAIAFNPAFPGAQTLAGQSRYALGDVNKATTEFQAALRQNPRDFTANLYLGIIRSNQRDFDTARPLLELAVELDPTHPLARLELAKLNAMTGHEDKAVKELEALEKETPQWIDPHIQLATLYYKLHRAADGLRERQIVQQLQDQQQKAGPQK
jgi:tetratricopeptide (TPR) repeat protein